MKKKKPAKKMVAAKPKEYTHKDGSGMMWRFEGGRPISALADKVMRECGY